MARKKIVRVVKGNIYFDKYKLQSNGRFKKVSSQKRYDSILNVEHWRDWSKADRRFASDFGGRVTIRSAYDYQTGTKLMQSYTITTRTEKKVYRRAYDNSLHKTNEEKEYYV